MLDVGRLQNGALLEGGRNLAPSAGGASALAGHKRLIAWTVLAMVTPAMKKGWNFWIDRGGTFTDVVARAPGGDEVVRKLLSVNPERYEDAALEAIRAILAENAATADDIAGVRLGTTVATNALLERKGAAVVLVVTQG